MPNIKFAYLYRDGSNYKNYHFIVFDNPDSVNLKDLETLIKSKLIYGTWFYNKEWKLPDLRLPTFNYDVDPTWHEFDSVEYTDETATSSATLKDFINQIKSIGPNVKRSGPG